MVAILIEAIQFLGLILTFVEAAGVKLVGGFLVSTILNRVQKPHLNLENLKFNLIDGCLALFLYDFWSSEKQTLNSFLLKDGLIPFQKKIVNDNNNSVKNDFLDVSLSDVYHISKVTRALVVGYTSEVF